MNEDMKYLVSVEEFAAFLHGDLTQEGMNRISSIVDTNKTMHDFVMSNHYIDDELSNYDSSNLPLPEELSSLDFDIPKIENVEIGEGSFIGKGAVLNAEARIGKMAIINSKALIEHECVVGDFAHVAVAAVLCGQVEVGQAAFIGANATVIQCLKIIDNEIVPAGMTIR